MKAATKSDRIHQLKQIKSLIDMVSSMSFALDDESRRQIEGLRAVSSQLEIELGVTIDPMKLPLEKLLDGIEKDKGRNYRAVVAAVLAFVHVQDVVVRASNTNAEAMMVTSMQFSAISDVLLGMVNQLDGTARTKEEVQIDATKVRDTLAKLKATEPFE